MLLRQSTKSTTRRLFHHLFSSSSSKLPPSLHHRRRQFSTKPNNNNKDDDNWNDAWETAWLPDDDISPTNTNTNTNTTSTLSSPWESGTLDNTPPLPPDVDAETKAFVADMNENWDERRRGKSKGKERINKEEEAKKSENGGGGLYSLENVKRDYRLKKQRVHAGLWVKEIEKLEEAKLGVDGHADDLDKLLDSCSEIFDSASNDLNNQKVPSTAEFKNKPNGWETTSKSEDGSVWEMSRREEDILLQEFERRMAFCKFQIASFIKSHIFSRRRPIDGWKYMIEVIGPNAKKGKGSVERVPSLADPATRAFTEDRAPTNGGHLTSPKRR